MDGIRSVPYCCFASYGLTKSGSSGAIGVHVTCIRPATETERHVPLSDFDFEFILFATAPTKEKLIDTTSRLQTTTMLNTFSSRAFIRDLSTRARLSSVLPAFRSRSLATVVDPIQKVRNSPSLDLINC